MQLLPIYCNPDMSDPNNRFGFRPYEPGVGPFAWVTVSDSARVEYLPDRGYWMLVEPGKSPRYAHEAYWADQRGHGELPITLPGPDQ